MIIAFSSKAVLDAIVKFPDRKLMLVHDDGYYLVVSGSGTVINPTNMPKGFGAGVGDDFVEYLPVKDVTDLLIKTNKTHKTFFVKLNKRTFHMGVK